MAKASGSGKKVQDDKQLRSWLSEASSKLTPKNLNQSSVTMLRDLQRKIQHWQAEIGYYVGVKTSTPVVRIATNSKPKAKPVKAVQKIAAAAGPAK